MAAIKKILVPIDFSESSRQAVRYATELALVDRPAITLLHVYQIPAYFFPDGSVVAGPELVTQLMNRIEASLAEARREAEALGAAEVKTVLVQGVPFVEIVRLAEEGAYDLVCMGTHGHTGLRHALLGSTAEKVVRKAPCPVLTVREPRRR